MLADNGESELKVGDPATKEDEWQSVVEITLNTVLKESILKLFMIILLIRHTDGKIDSKRFSGLLPHYGDWL